MEAKFIGDPNDGNSGPATVKVQGVDFPFGKWTAVDPKSALARKLKASNHFETRADKAAAPKSTKDGGKAEGEGDGDLAKLTKAELQQQLTDAGVEFESGANKDALVTALRAHLSDAGSPGQ